MFKDTTIQYNRNNRHKQTNKKNSKPRINSNEEKAASNNKRRIMTLLLCPTYPVYRGVGLLLVVVGTLLHRFWRELGDAVFSSYAPVLPHQARAIVTTRMVPLFGQRLGHMMNLMRQHPSCL
jgi:hypothetical protein